MNGGMIGGGIGALFGLLAAWSFLGSAEGSAAGASTYWMFLLGSAAAIGGFIGSIIGIEQTKTDEDAAPRPPAPKTDEPSVPWSAASSRGGLVSRVLARRRERDEFWKDRR